ncbi:MAG: integrase [Betaproteobacteria bacterium]|nr:integrase [Betaproteobacteria bacterium]
MIQELGGWQTRDMVQRYAHLNVEHLFKSAGVLDDIFAPAKVGQAHFGTMG